MRFRVTHKRTLNKTRQKPDTLRRAIRVLQQKKSVLKAKAHGVWLFLKKPQPRIAGEEAIRRATKAVQIPRSRVRFVLSLVADRIVLMPNLTTSTLRTFQPSGRESP